MKIGRGVNCLRGGGAVRQCFLSSWGGLGVLAQPRSKYFNKFLARRRRNFFGLYQKYNEFHGPPRFGACPQGFAPPPKDRKRYSQVELFIRGGVGGGPLSPTRPPHGFFSPLTQITPIPPTPPTNFVRRMWKNQLFSCIPHRVRRSSKSYLELFPHVCCYHR